MLAAARYELGVVPGWGQLPDKEELGDVVGVAVDSRGRVLVLRRDAVPVVVLTREGELLGTWGAGLFVDPHAIYVDRQDRVYITDRRGHAVVRCSGGLPELTLGTPGRPNAVEGDPFYLPAGVAVSADGDIFVADGYGNARLHRYSNDGQLKASWGRRGAGRGELDLPHGVAICRDGRVLVAEKRNNRIQVFSQDGHSLERWNGFRKPNAIAVSRDGTCFVAEQDHQVSAVSPAGEILQQWGGEGPSLDAGGFVAPHGIWIDSWGDLYVAEVQPGRRLQKFALSPPGRGAQHEVNEMASGEEEKIQ